MNSSIYLFIYTIVHSSTVVCMYLLIYAFIYSHIYLFSPLLAYSYSFMCLFIHWFGRRCMTLLCISVRIYIIRLQLYRMLCHLNIETLRETSRNLPNMYYPSWYLPPPSSFRRCKATMWLATVRSWVSSRMSCRQVVHKAWYACWHHLDIVDVVSILPSLSWLWCLQPRFESNGNIKDKSHDLQDEEQVESRHDRRGQLAILVQGKRRPAVHLGIISWGVSWWNCTKWQHPTTHSCANRSLVVGVLWQHRCQDGTPCLGVSAKKETISRDFLTDRLSQTTPCDSKTNGIFMFHSMLPHILSCFFLILWIEASYVQGGLNTSLQRWLEVIMGLKLSGDRMKEVVLW